MMYGNLYRGSAERPNANPVLDAMRDDDIGHDPWGTAMSWAGAVCDYLHHVALSDDIPASLDYGPAPYTPRGDGFDDESYPARYVAEAGLDTYTLTVAARCLSRYLDWCKAAGRDY